MLALPVSIHVRTDLSRRSDFLHAIRAALVFCATSPSANVAFSYREKFETIQKYFEPRFKEATKVGNEMIRTIEENLSSRKQA